MNELPSDSVDSKTIRNCIQRSLKVKQCISLHSFCTYSRWAEQGDERRVPHPLHRPVHVLLHQITQPHFPLLHQLHHNCCGEGFGSASHLKGIELVDGTGRYVGGFRNVGRLPVAAAERYLGAVCADVTERDAVSLLSAKGWRTKEKRRGGR